MATVRRLLLVAAALVAAGAAAVNAQYLYSRGQDVSPTFDGWTRNPDGTYSLYFGYLNRNTAEEIHIPAGPDNSFDDAGDAGQPTYFYPLRQPNGRHWWVFRTVVPADWPRDKRLVWTLRHRGQINRASGWLQPEYEVDPLLIARNGGDRFLFRPGDERDTENRAPVASGTSRHTVTLSQAAKFAVTLADDRRPRDEKGEPQGVRVRWMLYRGPAGVRFDPETNGPFPSFPASAETTARFKAPGNYRVRAVVSDGELFSSYDIDVTVQPGGGSSERTD